MAAKSKAVSKSAKATKVSKAAPAKASMSLRGAKATKQSQTAVPKTTATGLIVQVYDINGKSAGTVSLPKEIFGQKVEANLLAQAVRVYQANSVPHTAHTKTRGEVRGGGKKPWRQKGTGRARAGSTRSPLWVGGGITFGPRKNEKKLTLPQKMRKKALISALSEKVQAKQVKVISGIEKIQPKTKIVSNLLNKLETKGQSLLITSQNPPAVGIKLAARNIPNLKLTSPQNLNAYEVLKNNQILISKDAITLFK